MYNDLISRKQAQEAILNCRYIVLGFDKKNSIKALESVPPAGISKIRAAIVDYEIGGEINND